MQDSLVNKLLSSQYFSLGQFILAFIIVGLIILVPIIIFFFKYLSKMEKKFDKYVTIQEEKDKKIDKILNNAQVFEEILDKSNVILYFADNFCDEFATLFDEIKVQIQYMKQAFIKNYINGSHKDKALEILEKTNSILMECLSESYVESRSSFNSVVLIFIEVLNGLVLELIDELSKMDNPTIKATLIAKQFDNFNKLSLYLKLKYPTFYELSKDAVISELKKHFYAMDIQKQFSNLQTKEEQKLLDKLRGY